MGMSMHVVGFTPPDEEWHRMCAVWEACKRAEVDVPRDVYNYFNGEPPDPSGVEFELITYGAKEELHAAVSEFQDKGREGYEIQLSALPESVQRVRFYVSW